MDYTIYHADGSFSMNVSCSAESLADMIPDGGYSVEGTQSTLSTCVDGTLATPTDAEVNDLNTANALIDFRIERNKRLADTDWTQGNDSPLSATVKSDYESYRQNLRDMPQSDGFDPLNPEWPTLP